MTATRFDPPLPSMTTSAFKGVGSVSGIATSTASSVSSTVRNGSGRELGRDLQPGDARRLDLRRRAEQPKADVGDPDRPTDRAAPGRDPDHKLTGWTSSSGRASRVTGSEPSQASSRSSGEPGLGAKGPGRPGRSRSGSPPGGPRPARPAAPSSAGRRRSSRRPSFRQVGPPGIA